jgi:hypothetical protein
MVSWEDSFKLGDCYLQQLHQAILGLPVYLPVHSSDIAKELQLRRIYVFTGPIPEAGFRAPESGFQGITLHWSCDVSHCKVNKNKENLAGATRFGMVTNLHCEGTWTHSE